MPFWLHHREVTLLGVIKCWMPEMLRCRLCHKNRDLRNSHIVPKFPYKKILNAKRQIMGINGQGGRGWKPVQDGAKEYLFCECCEQHFNKYFEIPFRSFWVDSLPLPDPWIDDCERWIAADYESFKLFHLSILYRAGVSTLPMFSHVNLGPYEEIIRLLLLNRDPGGYSQYPVAGYAIVHHTTRRLVQMVSQPQCFTVGGRRCYGIIYGGVEWWICVASDRNHEFEKFALQRNGKMCFSVIPWNEIAVVQKAALALRNSVM